VPALGLGNDAPECRLAIRASSGRPGPQGKKVHPIFRGSVPIKAVGLAVRVRGWFGNRSMVTHSRGIMVQYAQPPCARPSFRFDHSWLSCLEQRASTPQVRGRPAGGMPLSRFSLDLNFSGVTGLPHVTPRSTVVSSGYCTRLGPVAHWPTSALRADTSHRTRGDRARLLSSSITRLPNFSRWRECAQRTRLRPGLRRPCCLVSAPSAAFDALLWRAINVCKSFRRGSSHRLPAPEPPPGVRCDDASR